MVDINLGVAVVLRVAHDDAIKRQGEPPLPLRTGRDVRQMLRGLAEGRKQPGWGEPEGCYLEEASPLGGVVREGIRQSGLLVDERKEANYYVLVTVVVIAVFGFVFTLLL